MSVCSNGSLRKREWSEKNHRNNNHLLLYKSRTAEMKVERCAASGACYKCKKRLMGRSQMKTRRKALLYSGVFVTLNQRTMKNNRTIFLYQSITGETITTFFQSFDVG